MYNPPAFAITDAERAEALVRTHNFALIAAVGSDGIAFAYAPTVLHPKPGSASRIEFHPARANPLSQILDAAKARLAFLGPHAYVSPDWYAAPGQVPTWNYIAAEASGPIKRLDEGALRRHLDDLATQEEAALGRLSPWSVAKVDPARISQLLGAIIGFELTVESLEGKRKLSQNKNAADAAGVIAGLERRGDAASLAIAQAMREPGPIKGGV